LSRRNIGAGAGPRGGRGREYRFYYTGGGILSLGPSLVVSLAEAREKHLTARKQLDAGLYPAAPKEAAEEALSDQAGRFGRGRACIAAVFALVYYYIIQDCPETGARTFESNRD